MRRRVALVLLPLCGFFLWMRPRAGIERDLALRFGASGPSVREVGLHVTRAGDREGAVLRDVSFMFPSGARDVEHRRLMLADGDYALEARVLLAGGRAVGITRQVHVEGDESVGVDLEAR